MNRRLMIEALKDGFSLSTLHGRLVIRAAEAGNLSVPTGRVVACDPGRLMNEGDFPAFGRTVPPGSYPVRVSEAHFDSGDVRVAQAALILDPAPPVRFELATKPGDDVATLEPGEFFGHGVDSGTSCFVDLEAAEVVCFQCKDRDFRSKGGFGDLCGLGDGNWRDAVIDPPSGLNMIVFRSGIGDGIYASYWGFGADDRLVCLITDFALLEERECFFVRCPECGVYEGELHAKFPCDAERCPFCGDWMCACGCMATILNLTPKERELANRFYKKLWWPGHRRKWNEIYDRWRAELSRKGRVPFLGEHLK